MSAPSVATSRFGLGARPGDEPAGDPRRWLLGQLDRFDSRPPGIAAAPTAAAVAGRLSDYYEQDRIRRRAKARGQPAGRAQPADMGAPAAAEAGPPDSAVAERQRIVLAVRQDYGASVAARMDAALATDTPFVERLVHFWANHFAVSTDKLELVGYAGSFEFEAIRPHVLGRFVDLLGAVERHPAMLIYLDQAVSVGPNSRFGREEAETRQRKLGLNENLARETMELHTLGVRTGYTQADVTEFARALTGWTVGGGFRGPTARVVRARGQPGRFFFADAIHEPGDRTIMGKRYGDSGEAQAQSVLADLAAHPATAAHLASKLARHFAGDAPPQAMVERLTQSYLRSGGDLPTVYRTLVASPEAWVDAPLKFKTPWEWAVSSYRALGVRQLEAAAVVGLANQLGQPIWKPRQPAGYDDVAASWAGPDAVMRRVEAAERLASRAPAVDVSALAATLFPGAVSPATAQALTRAESPAQALALLLVSPEMMRR